MYMKKAMSLALAALMLMGTLTGCGSSNSNSSDANNTNTPQHRDLLRGTDRLPVAAVHGGSEVCPSLIGIWNNRS